MSNWEYVFDLSMLFLFWVGVFSIIIAIIRRIRQNKHQHRNESSRVSSQKARETAD